MSIGAFDAAAAYGRTLHARAPLAERPPAAGAAAPAGFGGMVENMIGEAAGAMRAAEAASARQVAGRGDMIDVVTAIGAAEVALDTVVAVRDRVVSAYTDIMRMQI
jgi:flagellar hook-basal body complex protein FliE